MNTKRLILFSCLASCLFLFSCSDDSICISGEGRLETRILDLDDFTGIDLRESANVTVTQGDVQEVVVTGESNILDRLEMNVFNGVCDIDLKKGCYRSYHLSVKITVPDLDLVAVSGSGDVLVNDFEDQHNLDLDISGSGSINLNEFSGLQNIDARISGSGDIKAIKTISNVSNLDIKVSGSGSFKGYPIFTDNCHIKISGSADCFVTVNDLLDVNISGSGSVYFKGNPTLKKNITGSGKVKNKN